ncbi:MAG: hypothetical protein CFK52_08155 [Chloracidobacterium sp. CP2_5A]|nr:MAG: hypothetical protein CFK52_08155 [Chloracidobacterium sp. CP2_5A]
MIRCPQCGTDNLDGSEYCDECGYQLLAVRSAPAPVAAPSGIDLAPPPRTPPPATSLPPREASFGVAPAGGGQSPLARGAARAESFPPPAPDLPSIPMAPPPRPAPPGDVFALASMPAPPPVAPLASDPNRDPPVAAPSVPRAKLVIQRGGTIGKEFPLTETESNIGRWDADGGIFPDVDLDQDDPEAKVSRRHARIVCQDGQYVLEDLGSTNGTFVNRGRRLLPGNRHPLNDGDEIIVGKTFLKFHYIR